MPHYDFRTPRLYVDAPLTGGGEVLLDRDQANYLLNVLRLKRGDRVLLFNGRDGEWEASLASAAKRAVVAAISVRARAQPPGPDLHFLFAPLKHARLDYLVQKAVEMGVSLLQPVITRHTQVARVNLERMRADVQDPVAGLKAAPRLPLSVLIGPEGGFAEDERAVLLKRGNVARIALGP